ncbi:MAG: hypothetical protein MEQ84_02315 [Mesorhizobium sp.]|nr:hypothetical protein [Mesorhizobium sp.]
MNQLPITPRPEASRPLGRDPALAPAYAEPVTTTRASTGLYNPGQPILEGQDIAAMAVATVMALGPLSAYAFGFGL